MDDITIGEIIQKQKQYLELLEPREKPYELAIELVKKGLKFPESAYFPKLRLENSDSLSVSFGKDSSTVSVSGDYKAQNSYGTYVNGTFYEKFMLDDRGEWIEDTREFYIHYYKFRIDETKDEILKVIKEEGHTPKLVESEGQKEVYEIDDYEDMLLVATKKLTLYFNGQKLIRYDIKVPRGDEAVKCLIY
jgi:hypothetical protein